MSRRIDPRLIIGLALVIASVAAVVGLVATLDRRSSAYVATTTLLPGEAIQGSSLAVRAVSLDDADGLYLHVGQLPEGGLIVTRPIPAGELIPLAALSTPVGTGLTAVVVSPAAALSARIVPGSTVELWMTAPADDGVLASPPRVLAADAIVASIEEPLGLTSFGSASSVELLVPKSRLALILQAQADGAVLSVVPVGMTGVGT